MKNKKGFTLIELLAVIVVLGLIGLLAYPAIEKALKSARDDLYDAQITNIINGAKNWIADHPHDIPKNDNDELTISLCELKLGSYIDLKLSNPKTKKMFDCGTKIKIKKVNNTYEYNVDFTDTTEENVPEKIIYPKVELIGNHLEYFNVNNYYVIKGLIVDGNTILESNDLYDLNITTEFKDKNGNISEIENIILEGSYIIKYELINKITNVKVVLYQTIIVNEYN